MGQAVNKAYDKIYNWLDRNPNAQTLPFHIQKQVDLIQQYDQAKTIEADQVFSREEIEADRETLDDMMKGYARRRELELMLADYIKQVSRSLGRVDFLSISERLRSCRQGGPVLKKPDGNLMIAWEEKCGLVKLCPDESREEQKRLDKFYNPAITKFLKDHPTHRAFYLVPTTGNYPPGELLKGKYEIFQQFKQFMRPEHEYCPVMFEEGTACKLPRKGIGQPIYKTKGKPIADFKGALVVQEDPLSSVGWWNVHLNAILLVKGPLDYKKVRREWGKNIHIEEIDKSDPSKISSAIRELIKYAATIVGEKSEDKAKAGTSQAPGITDWPHKLFAEWWDSHRIPTNNPDKPFKTFRRVRAYGCLYAVHRDAWNEMTNKQQAAVCRDADLSITERNMVIGRKWNDLVAHWKKKDRERLKVRLRKAMLHGEGLDLDLVVCIGSLKYNGRSYSVDLILGDNFSGSGRFGREVDNFQTGPPPDY